MGTRMGSRVGGKENPKVSVAAEEKVCGASALFEVPWVLSVIACSVSQFTRLAVKQELAVSKVNSSFFILPFWSDGEL